MDPYDDDILWCEAQVRMLDETIRQTLERQPATSQAVRTLRRLRDRYERIAEELNKP